MTQTPPSMAPPPVAMPGGQKKSVGIAVAALVLGICGFIPWFGLLCGLVGVILGIVALAQQTSRKGLAIAGIITGVTGPVLMIALIVALALPALGYAKEQARQALCQANLNGIGKSIIIYSSENNDAYPPNLEMMISSSGMPKELMRCPSDKSNRDCDYFYSPPAEKTSEDTNDQTIIACDFKSNHSGKGRNVLFSDGHVQWLTEEQFQQELQQPYNAAFSKALREAEGP
ncbi:MAG: DUF4190 domain-containing protein [Planctomycetota bacterium]|nr:DUF4190 domain-containing protein [Planctomycetota bacterium]